MILFKKISEMVIWKSKQIQVCRGDKNMKKGKKSFICFLIASICYFIVCIVNFIVKNNITAITFLCLGFSFLCLSFTHLNKDKK